MQSFAQSFAQSFVQSLRRALIWFWRSPPHAFPTYISRFPLFLGVRGSYLGLRRYRPILRPIFLVDSFIHSFNIIQFIKLFAELCAELRAELLLSFGRAPCGAPRRALYIYIILLILRIFRYKWYHFKALYKLYKFILIEKLFI